MRKARRKAAIAAEAEAAEAPRIAPRAELPREKQKWNGQRAIEEMIEADDFQAACCAKASESRAYPRRACAAEAHRPQDRAGQVGPLRTATLHRLNAEDPAGRLTAAPSD